MHLLHATEEIMTCPLFYSENVSRSHTFNFHDIQTVPWHETHVFGDSFTSTLAVDGEC